MSGPPCVPGKTVLIDGGAVLFLRENEAAAGSAESLMGGRSDDVGVLAGVRVKTRGDQSRNMRHVDQQQGADRIGNFAETREIQFARVGAAAGDDHFRLVLSGDLRHLVEIDLLGFLAHLISGDVISLAGKIQLVAVREMSAVGEIEAHDGVAGLQNGGESGLVGLRSGVRLHVDVLGVEELFGAVAREVFHFIGILAAAVITLAGIAFGVLVGEDAAGGFEHGFRGEILARDQFDLAVLPTRFLKDELVDGGIDFGKRSRNEVLHNFWGWLPNFNIGASF